MLETNEQRAKIDCRAFSNTLKTLLAHSKYVYIEFLVSLCMELEQKELN